MFTKPVILIVLAVLLLLIAAFAVACAKHRFQSKSPEEKAEWVVQKISGELDLDEAQEAKLNEIKTELLAKHKSFKGDKEQIWDELHTQLRSDKIDQEKVNSIFTEKEAQFSEMRAFAVTKFAEFHAVLTPEQKNTLVEKLDKMHDRCRH